MYLCIVMTHVIPVRDIVSHVQSPQCKCRPNIDEETQTCIHNAGDFRELLESACAAETQQESLAFYAQYQDRIWGLVQGERVTAGWAREKTRLGFAYLFWSWSKRDWGITLDESAHLN